MTLQPMMSGSGHFGITYAGIFNGEHYDARFEKNGTQ